MFFVQITSQSEPFPGRKTCEALMLDLRTLVIDSIITAGGDERLNPQMISVQTILANSTDVPRHPVHVLLFTSDPKWVAPDNSKRMNRFMAHALKLMPFLKEGNLAVDVVSMKHFVSK